MRMPQMMNAEMMETGSAIANQDSQEGAPPTMDMRSIAKMFCGLLIGLVMPPRLLAKAIPAPSAMSPPQTHYKALLVWRKERLPGAAELSMSVNLELRRFVRWQVVLCYGTKAMLCMLKRMCSVVSIPPQACRIFSSLGVRGCNSVLLRLDRSTEYSVRGIQAISKGDRKRKGEGPTHDQGFGRIVSSFERA